MSSSLEDESGSDFEFVDDEVEESSTILEYQDDNQDSFGDERGPTTRMTLSGHEQGGDHRQSSSVGGAPLGRRRRSSKQECFIEKLYSEFMKTVHG